MLLIKKTIILGELQKSHWINAIILTAKKTIFNAKIDKKRSVKLIFNYERRKFRLRGREDSFEKRWGLMIEYYNE